MRNPQLFGRIFNTPLLIHPAKLDAIIVGIGERFGIQDYQVKNDMAMIATGEKKRPGYKIIGGIAVIDVFGVLSHRGKMEGDSTYIYGYNDIGKAIHAAVLDGDVSGILLEMSTPGGEVPGAFELAANIKEWSAIKPIHTAISNLSASAGYLLAAATNKIGITETGVAGSIGVVMRHADISKMAKKEGITVSHIYAGSHKVDGNQFEPLSDSVRERMQAEVNYVYDLFVSTISEYRGLSSAVIRAQEAAVFTGQSAINAGLADVMATADNMLIDMQQTLSKSTTGITMTAEKKGVESGVAAQQARDEGEKTGMIAGALAERTRISAILNHDEAKGRETQAKAFAFETDMDAETAGKLLASAPKVAEPAANQGNAFENHMNALGNPDIGADADGDAQENDEQAAMKLILGGKS